MAFVADASILPRESGVSGRPMKDAVKFTAPESMKVSFVLRMRERYRAWE